MSVERTPSLGALVRVEWVCPRCLDVGYAGMTTEQLACRTCADEFICLSCFVPVVVFLTAGIRR